MKIIRVICCFMLCVAPVLLADPVIAPALQGRPMSPAGKLVMDTTTGSAAVGALPVKMIHSPDHAGADGQGRFLIIVNSGYGVEFASEGHTREQSLAVIDLNAFPEPAVVQNIYFPSPQSASVGAVFDPYPDNAGNYRLYVSGGVENKIWMFTLKPELAKPLQPEAPDLASVLSVAGFATSAPTARVNSGIAPVYPLGIGLSADANSLYVANNLADSLGVIVNLRGTRNLRRVDLHGKNVNAFIYPYEVAVAKNPVEGGSHVYVSCWGTAEVLVVDPALARVEARIKVLRHPTEMLLNSDGSRLYVVNSGAEKISVIDTATNESIEEIGIGLAEKSNLPGDSPESLALNDAGTLLYVANAHSQSIAVIALSERAVGQVVENGNHSRVIGFIPTGIYPSAVAVANGQLFIGNGKGTGFRNSSQIVSGDAHAPNMPNPTFPGSSSKVGEYILSLISGNISYLPEPSGPDLAQLTRRAMMTNGLLDKRPLPLFKGQSPIHHIIYVIKENRTYDQVFGDIASSGDGKAADGDPNLAIFGSGVAARSLNQELQNITPNQHALAVRFGLFDRFFVNAEASPDGHNWSTAAFSSDYVDKAFRWSYSGRGRGYDYEGFNRLPSIGYVKGQQPILKPPITATDLAQFMRRYLPYLEGGRDIAEPASLYLWDAAARAGLSYRNYGEFIAAISAKDIEAFNQNQRKGYPDTSPTAAVFATKKSLEGHFNRDYRGFDLTSPDAMTVDSYRLARAKHQSNLALISPQNRSRALRGTSRMSVWLKEFKQYVKARKSGHGNELPNLSILHLPSNHTAGLYPGLPTPQFMVADNDYALARLVEAVSRSDYWTDTAIFVVEDDAQNGPDHVDAHRSPVLVISAYNKPGMLVHQYHNTVSLIRTMELLLGIKPMNQLDKNALPMDIFQATADLTPFTARLPELSLDNLQNRQRVAADKFWIEKSLAQDLSAPDLADPGELNKIIWYSVRPGLPMPVATRLPVFDALRYGIASEADSDATDFIHFIRLALSSGEVRSVPRQ